MPKKLMCIVLFLLKINVGFTQTDSNVINKKPSQLKYYSNSGFGIYFPIRSSEKLDKSGIIYNFQVQVNHKSHYFGRLTFDQFNIGYTDKAVINGLNIKIDNKLQTLNIGIDGGYTVDMNKKIALFAYIGIGYASVEIPKVDYNTATKIVDISSISKPFLSFRGGVGVDYKLIKSMIIFTDFQYLTIPFKTDISNKELNGISCQIGIKTPLN